MHINWKQLAIGLAVLPFVVLFVTWIGFFNVGASSGLTAAMRFSAALA